MYKEHTLYELMPAQCFNVHCLHFSDTIYMCIVQGARGGWRVKAARQVASRVEDTLKPHRQKDTLSDARTCYARKASRSRRYTILGAHTMPCDLPRDIVRHASIGLGAFRFQAPGNSGGGQGILLAEPLPQQQGSRRCRWWRAEKRDGYEWRSRRVLSRQQVQRPVLALCYRRSTVLVINEACDVFEFCSGQEQRSKHRMYLENRRAVGCVSHLFLQSVLKCDRLAVFKTAAGRSLPCGGRTWLCRDMVTVGVLGE